MGKQGIKNKILVVKVHANDEWPTPTHKTHNEDTTQPGVSSIARNTELLRTTNFEVILFSTQSSGIQMVEREGQED